MNNLIVEIIIFGLTFIMGAVGIWGVYQFTKPFPHKEKKECKNLN